MSKLKIQLNLLVVMVIFVVAISTIAILVYYPMDGYEITRASTLTVCASDCDYSSITAALATASSGDTVNVRAGTYNEASGETFTINIPAGVTLRGAGREQTIIIPSNTTDRVVQLNGNGAVLDGFTISCVNGGDDCVGALVAYDDCVVSDNTILASGTSAGKGIEINPADAAITATTISGNVVYSAQRCVFAQAGNYAITAALTNNILDGCTTGFQENGDSTITLIDNIISNQEIDSYSAKSN